MIFWINFKRTQNIGDYNIQTNFQKNYPNMVKCIVCISNLNWLKLAVTQLFTTNIFKSSLG